MIPRDVRQSSVELYTLAAILRKKILEQAPSKGRHILVYQTVSGDDSVTGALKKCPGEFVFYGCNKDLRDGNVRHRKFSEDGFIKDLASSRAVITNGGLSLITEALYLGKPVLSVPIAGQFEQIANAYYLDKLGYGKYCDTLTAAAVKAFTAGLASYEKKLKDYPRAGCSAIVAKLESLIARYSRAMKYKDLLARIL